MFVSNKNNGNVDVPSRSNVEAEFGQIKVTFEPLPEMASGGLGVPSRASLSIENTGS